MPVVCELQMSQGASPRPAGPPEFFWQDEVGSEPFASSC